MDQGDTVPIRFSHPLRAEATSLGDRHDNVFRIHLRRSGLDARIQRLFSWLLPSVIRRHVGRVCPLWLLPRTVVLKVPKPGWADEFDNEKHMYARLRPLQGDAIPVFFGDARFEGQPALVLSHVDGYTLLDGRSLERDFDDVRRMLDEAFRSITRLGIAYDHVKLDNVLLVGGGKGGDKAVVIDLESAWELSVSTKGTTPERTMVYAVDDLMRFWSMAQTAHQEDRHSDEACG